MAGGAEAIQQYLRAGLIDAFQVHQLPLLLGGGRRLFDELGSAPPQVQIARVIASPNVTHLRYRVVR